MLLKSKSLIFFEDSSKVGPSRRSKSKEQHYCCIFLLEGDALLRTVL